ncbi:hypothetical protein Q9966_006986 [Columba livia]|nr:hypothetical protein Q9966_006986 [Columba livia]
MLYSIAAGRGWGDRRHLISWAWGHFCTPRTCSEGLRTEKKSQLEESHSKEEMNGNIIIITQRTQENPSKSSASYCRVSIALMATTLAWDPLAVVITALCSPQQAFYFSLN